MQRKYGFIFIFFSCLQLSNSAICNYCISNDGGLTCSDRYSHSFPPFCDRNNCKPKYKDSQCYDCSEIRDGMYTIENNACLINVCKGDVFIEETKECTSLSIVQNEYSTLYKLGDFYYINIPTNAECPTGIGKECSCNSYFYRENINRKVKYTCFDLEHNSPKVIYKYYDPITKEFFTECPIGLNHMKLNALKAKYTRCSESCEADEWNIAIPNNANNNIIEHYCVNSCNEDSSHSPNTLYNLEYINDGYKSCVKTCPPGTYKREVNSPDISSCLSREQCPFYSNENPPLCLTTCIESINNLYHISGNRECIHACLGEYKYVKDYICYKLEECNFINGNSCFDECPNGMLFHNEGSKNCIVSCGLENRYYPEGGKTCYTSCSKIPGDYKYEQKDISGIEARICYLYKPDDIECEAYYRKSDGVFKCITRKQCVNDMLLKYLFYQECKYNCDGYYQIELKDNIDNYNYIKCFVTLDDILSNSNFIFCDISQKKCWEHFPIDGFYYINYEFEIGKYEVVKECAHFYYQKQEIIDGENRYWCLESCYTEDKFFLRGNKQCYNSCKDINIYYYDTDNNECLETCELRPDKQFCYPIPPENEPTPCYSSCIITPGSQGRYYNYDSHVCLLSCSYNDNNYLYHKYTTDTADESQFICYPSCLDIHTPSSYIGEIYRYAYVDNSCTFSRPDTSICRYLYSLSDGVKKCATSEDCKKLNYLFLIDDECVLNCDEDYYKIPLIEDPEFTKCYKTPNDCYLGENQNQIYYSKEFKRCYREYQQDYFIKVTDSTKIELVQVCEHFFYIEQNTGFKYCTEQCMTTPIGQLYFVEGEKKCESSCNNVNKHYYDPNNNKCLDTCVGTNMQYALQLNFNDDTKPCLLQCPNPQHYFISKRENNNLIYECVDNCPFNSQYTLLDIKTNECLQSCFTPDYIQVDNICYKICDVNNDYIYINSDTYDCAKTCPTVLKSYVQLYTYHDKNVFLCKSICEENKPFRLGDQCVEKCPQQSNYIGYNNICKETCAEDPNGPYYFQINEYETPTPNYKIYECVTSCTEAKALDNLGQIKYYPYYAKAKSNECLRECPLDFKFTLESKPGECIESCPYDFPFYRLNENKCSSEPMCRDGINNYFLDGICTNLNTCISSTYNKKYVDSRNICLDKCPENELLEKIENYFDTYKCLRNCGNNKYILKKNAIDIPQCVDDCPKEMNFIGKDNFCKSSCEDEDGIYYYKLKDRMILFTDPIQNYIIYKCVDGCKQDYDSFMYKEANNGRQCYQQCTTAYPYLSPEENLCYDNCLNSNQNPFTLPDQKICGKNCYQNGQNIYWGDNKVCISDCNILGDTKIVDTLNNKCVEKCDPESSNHFELDGKCVYSCDNGNPNSRKKRYSTGDYKCRERCGNDEYIINENQCVKECNKFKIVINTGEKECIETCPSENPFYYPGEKICLPNCKNNDKVVEGKNICVSSCKELTDGNYFFYQFDVNFDRNRNKLYNRCVLRCPENKPFIDGNTCIEHCPINDNKFYIDSDINPNKYCLYDCPEQYPYYTIETSNIDPNDKRFKCKATCEGYFVPNSNSLIIAKLCLNDCPDDSNNYKYKIIDGNLNKCYAQCPPEARYHFDLSSRQDNFCYEKCPAEKKAPYREKDHFVCKKLSEFNRGFILYDTKEWTNSISKCPEEYPYYSVTDDNKRVTICLKECNFKYYNEGNDEYILYGYLTPYNSCVSDCQYSYLVTGENFKNDEISQKCICQNLFYINSTFHIVCYPGDIQECKDTNLPHYPLRFHNTLQCLQICNNDRILTPSEDECYEKDTLCSDMVSYSYTKLIIKEDGQKKCDCIYKFYFDNNKKVCLAENSACPLIKNLLILDTLECIDSCPSNSKNYYPFKFQNYCLKHCPSNSFYDSVTKQCYCKNFWYELSPGNFKCLEGNCLENYPVYIDSTKQCLKTCKGSDYKYLYNNKCYDNCNFIPNIEEVNIESPLADFKCDCNRPWFYDIERGNEMNCPPDDNSIKTCRDYTNKNLPFMVNITRQCVEKCPNEYPYFFNHKCYKSCEEANDEYKYNIEKVENSYECRCQNLWIIDPDDIYHTDKICYDKNINECPPYPIDNSIAYQIFETKQCVENKGKCASTSFKFNMICYEKCPQFTLEIKKNTLENNLDNTCTCSREKDRIDSYLYLEYKKYGNTYYKCGLKSCPDKFIVDGKEYVRNILLENEKKCVKSCLDGTETNVYLYSFRNKCVIECPILTETIKDECVFYDVNNITTINSLDKLKEAANIQAKELYGKSETLSGYLLNKFNSSLQIYAVDRLNNYKGLSMKSNLTYIDIGTCLDKIYSDKNLNDEDKILIVKYDLLNRMNKNDNSNNDDNNIVEISTDNKFLINQVEYEFYLENNMEKIEGSICSPYEIEISYPIFFNKNKFNNFETGFNENNYLKLFKIGKVLNDKDPEADTFNKENKVYKDICFGVELEGKDLVLEDRYKILYPNNISLCESNCTMSYTDFTIERINCMCTYKEIFDFYRIDEETNDILHDPNFVFPSQSKANIEIIKCIGTIKFKKDLLKNEAFYFSSVIVVVEIITAVISFIQGVKIVSSFTQEMFNMNGAKIIFQGNKSNLVSLSTTNRLMNNPPKKDKNGKDSEELEEENKKNIVIVKNALNNNQPIKIIPKNLDNDLINSNSNSNLDYNNDIYDPNKEQGFPNNKKKINLIGNSINSKSYNTNITQKKIAEFIPPKYNFKFFKPTDKGIIKQIPRSKIPFKTGKDTKYLVEYKKDVIYNKNYLKGPFYEDQNIIEIISDNGSNSNQMIKSNNDILIEHSDGSNAILTKNMKTVFRNSDLFKKENYYNSKKRTISYNINKLPQNYIKIRKINPFKNLKKNNHIDEYEYKKEDELKKVDNITSIYTLMKREQTYLRRSYEFYMSKKHPGILPTLLAEIFDKIYLVKTLIFLKKFEITSIYISLYMFYHILLASLLCGFFTINTIKRIWADDDFPTLRFYLLYGFIANVIDWVIYKIFILLLDNQDRIRALVKLGNDFTNNKSLKFITKENEEGMNNDVISTNIQVQQRIEEKYDELMKKIRIQTALFYIANFFLTGFLFMYLISFFAIYTGTKKLVIKAYYISIIEITIIKFVYGLSLGSLRIAAEINKFKNLYNFVYICDKYLS